jgi:hypothetical protein
MKCGGRIGCSAALVRFTATLCEESFAIVWPDRDDPTFPVIYPNQAGTVAARFHPTKLGYCIEAAKWWIEDGRIRLNLYFLDRIEKYATASKQTWLPASANHFVRFYEPDGSEPWPLPNPYSKVPVFRFVNDPGVNGEGKSELRDVIAPQNGLNKSLCDMMVAAEFEAFAQRWVVGFEPQTDPKTKQPVNPFRSGPGNLWIAKNSEAKFGEFSRGDIEKFIAVQNSFRSSIARVSRTPQHQVVLTGGDWPSGESLKTACEPQTNKAKDRQLVFGSTWDDVGRFCLEIKGRRDVAVQTQWNDPTPRQTESEKWETAVTQQSAGVSVEQTLRERGYSDEQIADFMAKQVPTDLPPSPVPTDPEAE